MWGTFPLYWPLLEPAGAAEILAHRILWSVLTMGVLVVALRRTTHLRALVADRRVFALLSLASVVITVNWVTYIWGVNNGRVVETSLGYFINPLVTVLMGVFLLGERLRPLQWFAMAVAGGAVAVLTLDYGRLPYVALVLAFSFGTYGLLRKTANVGAIESLALETALISPFAAAYVGWLLVSGTSSFGTHGVGHALLFTTTGIVTAIKSNGFFLQAPETEIDSDPNTSEGIFVFTSSAPPVAASPAGGRLPWRGSPPRLRWRG